MDRVNAASNFVLIRSHRSATYVDAAYCYWQSSVVDLSVCHDREPCKNGWTDWDAVWVVDSGGSKEACVRWGAYWRHLANTTEPSVCGDDAAFLSDYFDHLFLNFMRRPQTQQGRTALRLNSPLIWSGVSGCRRSHLEQSASASQRGGDMPFLLIIIYMASARHLGMLTTNHRWKNLAPKIKKTFVNVE